MCQSTKIYLNLSMDALAADALRHALRLDPLLKPACIDLMQLHASAYDMTACKALAQSVIDSCAKNGAGVAAAAAGPATAAKPHSHHSQRHYRHCMQRPDHLVPGISAKPW